MRGRDIGELPRGTEDTVGQDEIPRRQGWIEAAAHSGRDHERVGETGEERGPAGWEEARAEPNHRHAHVARAEGRDGE